MIFTSFTFIIFAFIFFLLYPFIKKVRQLRYIYIVISSFIFYGWWDWRYLFLIIFTGSVDFIAALLIERYRNLRNLFLLVSLCCNLSILFCFKYLLWLLNSLFSVSGGIIPLLPAAENFLPELFQVLPVGISFYTFQSMSYTIDVYRENLVLRQLEIPRNVTKNSPLPSGKDTPGEEGTPCGRGRGPSPYHRV